MIAGFQQTSLRFNAGFGRRRAVLCEDEPGTQIGVHELFESQARRSPEVVALEFREQQLSYDALDRRAGEISHALTSRGIGAGALVGICAERGAAFCAGVIAILKSGAAYVPLDPALPDHRLQSMLEDCRPAVVLAEKKFFVRLSSADLPLIGIATADENPLPGFATEPRRSCGGDNLAYVIYTSGSTGQPKGVMVEQRALLNHCLAMARLFELGPADRVLQFASVGFDVAAEEMFPTWASGATVVIWPGGAGLAPIRNFVDFIDAARISVLNLPAPYWHEWVAELDHVGVPASVRLVIVGSDVMLADKASVWQRHPGGRIRLINAYGPAEGTITATTYDVPSLPPKGNSLPIGQPISNVQAYVRDELGCPVAPGVAGELCLGGAGLARGYLHRLEETAAKFIIDPCNTTARLYRTGDRVCARPDGNLEFLGRLDDQVKVRGFRVEIGDIEALLRRHGSIRNAVVVAREDETGSRALVAYIVGRRGAPPSARQLCRYVQAYLPHYMVPRAFVPLLELPLTAAGKIDRNRLPAPCATRAELENDYVAPRSDTETALAQIWERVLNLRPVGVRDDFYELAGDSLLLIRAAALIEQRFKISLALTALFQARTVEALARMVAAKRQTPGGRICPYRVHGARPPLFCHGGSDDLARSLGADQPIYWLDPHGMNGGRIPETIESMAAEYCAEMQAIQPRGPYCLLGYSFGGLVMLELARLLRERGEQIALLVLVDPSAPPEMAAAARHIVLAPPAADRQAGALQFGWPNFMAVGVRRLRRTFIDWLCRSAVARGGVVPARLRLFHFAQGCDRALQHYRAKVYPGSFLLFRRPDNLTEEQWRGLAAEPIKIHDSWIDHNDFLESPYVQQICGEIDRRMQPDRQPEDARSMRRSRDLSVGDTGLAP